MAFRPSVRLLCVVVFGLERGLINAEIGLVAPHLKEIFSASEMEGTGLRGEAGALLSQVRDIFRRERLIDQGILQSPGHGLRGVDVTQSHDFAYVMVRIEAPLL